MSHSPISHQKRCGLIALVGVPNAGKSTLINTLVDENLSIVTHKAQTTRTLIRGIITSGYSQAIFVDTPGIMCHPTRQMEKAIVSKAWFGAKSADLIALLVDASRGLDDKVISLISTLKNITVPQILVLNKIDLVKRYTLLELASAAHKHINFQKTFMVSSLKRDGTSDLLTWCLNHIPHTPWLYPEEQLSDISMRDLASNITRKHILLRLHEEIPYNVTVETTHWNNRKDESEVIHQVIYTKSKGQKKIIVGKSGETIKSIAIAARKEISKLIGQTAHLFLLVKVRKDWMAEAK